MGTYTTKTAWQRALRPVVVFCLRHRIQPDVFTYGALAVSMLAGWALFRAGAQRAWLRLMPVYVLTRLWFNLMDGLLARELGLGGAWGEVKNEFGDRLADGAHPLGAGALPSRPLCSLGLFVH
jgi:phosphatidylglycerophosphate synthase